MKYQVATYSIVPEKPFQSFEEAVQYIQDKYPELDKQTIEKYLTPKIVNNGNDQSGNVSEENSVSAENDAKISSAGVKRVKPDADKPR